MPPKKLVKLLYKLEPRMSNTPVHFTEIGMRVRPGVPFEVAPNVAEFLLERGKGRIIQIEDEKPKEKPKTKPKRKTKKKTKKARNNK